MKTATAEELLAPVRDGLLGSERELERLLTDPSPTIAGLRRHLAAYAGKRLRPALVHLCGGLSGTATAEHAVLGAIVEALHLASLLHDDVLDGATLRRRLPTLNALTGNQVPVLLGDFIYARAFARSLDLSTPEASRVLAAASAALCRGEIEQSAFREAQRFDEAVYFAVIRDKTASLFGAACRLGARYAGADEAEAATLERFGLLLGTAFQIVDDALDLVGDEQVVGKSLGTDLETGKVTLPVIRLARRLSGARLERYRALLFGPVAGSRRAALRAEFVFDEVVAECHTHAAGLLADATALLGPFPDGPERNALEECCGFVLGRAS